MNKSEKVIEDLRKFSRYDPGKPIRGAENKEIPNSTALSPVSSAFYDQNPSAGGHFIERYGANDSVDKFRITHEEAKHLLSHFKKYTLKHDNSLKEK